MFRKIQEFAYFIVIAAGSLATFVYLTFFDGERPTTVLGWLYRCIEAGGMTLIWPIYWPVRLLFFGL